jgi:hypothetical protein
MEKLVVGPARPAQCLGCRNTTLFEDTGPTGPTGWIAETWKTIGGKTLRVVICFSCRNLTEWRLYRTEQMIGAQL